MREVLRLCFPLKNATRGDYANFLKALWSTVEQFGDDLVVEMQIAENSEFAGKVSKMHIEEGHHAEVADHTSSIAVNQDKMSNGDITPRKHVLEYHDGKSYSAEMAHSSVGIMNDKNAVDDIISESIVPSRPSPQSNALRISDEIVTVPLDEIHIHKDDSLEAKNDDGSESLPLSDAPLIGHLSA